MIIGKAEFIDEFIKYIKHELDSYLPLRGEEYNMLGKARSIINAKVDHLQFRIAERNGGTENGTR